MYEYIKINDYNVDGGNNRCNDSVMLFSPVDKDPECHFMARDNIELTTFLIQPLDSSPIN